MRALRVMGMTVLLLIGAGILTWFLALSPDAKDRRLTTGFMNILPDSLSDHQSEEIAGLFDTLFERAKREKVAIADVEYIRGKMRTFTAQGSIPRDSLLYFMAEVGFTAFKKDYHIEPDYVDHPTLNPEAGLYYVVTDTMAVDSTGQHIPIKDTRK